MLLPLVALHGDEERLARAVRRAPRAPIATSSSPWWRRTPRGHRPDARYPDGDLAVGWMKLTPRSLLPKLLKLGPYRALPRDPNEPVWSIGCFLVDPGRRHQGRRVGAHPRLGRSRARSGRYGGRGLPAPMTDHALHDEEACGCMGTAALFSSCGFTETAGEGPYPVMRRAVLRRQAFSRRRDRPIRACRRARRRCGCATLPGRRPRRSHRRSAARRSRAGAVDHRVEMTVHDEEGAGTSPP